MTNDTPTRTTLEAVPARALTLLGALSRHRELSALLQAAGYTVADQEEGWRLLHISSGYAPSTPVTMAATAASEAIVELDAWDEDGFRRIGAALRRLHRPQHDFVFAGGLSASTGVRA